MISSPHLATVLICDVPWRLSLYLNRCVAASETKALKYPGSNVPFLLEPILAELEGRRYIGPILSMHLAESVSGRIRGGGSGSGNRSKCSGDVGGSGSGSGGVGGSASAKEKRKLKLLGGNQGCGCR